MGYTNKGKNYDFEKVFKFNNYCIVFSNTAFRETWCKSTHTNILLRVKNQLHLNLNVIVIK